MIQQRKPPLENKRSEYSNGEHSVTGKEKPTATLTGKPRLLSWEEVPTWYQNEVYLRRGFRPVSNSYRHSLGTLFCIHNETVNIYSHLAASLLFFALPYALYSILRLRYATASTADVLVFSTFFFGVAICFLLSSIFHTFRNHSHPTHILLSAFDYIGIVLLMWGSTLPCVYYGFYCSPSLQLAYYTLVSVLAALCIYVTLQPQFRTPAHRPFRTLMYASLGFSFLVPIVHGLLLFGWEVQRQRMSLGWLGIMAGCNMTGAGAYAWRIPEKWFPRRFDIWGSSHQIMHCMVVAAAIAHLVGLVQAFEHVHGTTGTC